MAAIAPAQEVARPTSAAARPYSIIDAANGPYDLPRLADVWYDVPWCAAATAYDIDCDSPPGLDKGPGTTVIAGGAFVVDADLSCPMPARKYAVMESDVRAKLDATEHVAVEEHVADGLAAAASADAGNNLGTVLDIVQAVSVLENHLYVTRRYGLAGVLHVPVALSAMGADRSQWSNSPRPYRTPKGTLVYFNAGLADNEVFVTGQLTLWRRATATVTPEQQAADLMNNEWNMHAERDWAAAWECVNAYVTVEVA
jgi:hypothetical protein